MKVDLPLTVLGQVYQPGGVLLMTTGQPGTAHVMPVAWHTHMLEQPEQIACILRRDSKALQGVVRDQSCVLNVPSVAQLETVMQRGGLSSQHADRSDQQFWLVEASRQVPAGSLSEGLAHIECQLVQTEIIGGFVLCMLQPVSLRTARDWLPAGDSTGRVSLRGQDLATLPSLLEPARCLHLVGE